VRLSSVLVAALLCAAVVRAAPPVKEKVCFPRRTNSNLAEVRYDLYDPDSDDPFTVTVLFSSDGGSEVASWYPEKKHGLFTYYLL